jgi:hypothetical protein
LKSFGFRFLFIYLLLFIPTFPLDLIPIVRQVVAWYESLWRTVVPWLVQWSGHGEIQPQNGTDSAYTVAKMLVQVVLAAGVALAWVAWSRSDRDSVLHGWLRVAIRYFVAVAMFNYGVVKVFNTQFLSLGPERLILRYGDTSPAELAWAYMGYSNAYTTFCGAAEVLGAVCLFFRRSTLFGALVLCPVLVNIVAMNLCYGIGVTIFSSHLLLMVLVLLAPDASRLANVVVFNRPTAAAAPATPLPARWMVLGRLVAKTAFVGMVIIFMTGGALSLLLVSRTGKSPLYGLYEVETFTRNGKTYPPLLTDASRWRWFIVGKYNKLIVETMNGRREVFCGFTDAPAARLLNLVDCRSASQLGEFRYEESAPGQLSVRATFRNDQLALNLRRVDDSEFRLLRPTNP